MNQKINVYHNASIIISRKTSKSIVSWIIILTVLFIFSSLFIVFYKYHPYEQTYGYVKRLNENYVLVIYVKKDNINEFNKNKILMNEVSKNYQVLSISKDYYVIDNEMCYEVILNIDLDEIDKIENNILKLVIEKETTTLLKQIKKGWTST